MAVCRFRAAVLSVQTPTDASPAMPSTKPAQLSMTAHDAETVFYETAEESPADAQQDWEDYVKSLEPVARLLVRLGMDRSQIRSHAQLNWSKRNLDDADALLVAEIFKKNSCYTANPVCEMLGLDQNNIGDAGLAALSDVFMVSNSMLAQCSALWLNHNSFGDAGMVALCEALKAGAFPRLQKLYVHDNQIGDEGAAALADAIRNASQVLDRLRFIYIRNNPPLTGKGRTIIDGAAAKLGRITIEY